MCMRRRSEAHRSRTADTGWASSASFELVLTRYRVPAELVAAVKRTLDEGNTLLRQLHTDELVALARHHANRHREIMQWAPRFFADLASSHAKRGQEYADEAQRRARAGGAT